MHRLASADILPFDFKCFSETVEKYVKEVSKLVDEMREETEELNRRISEKAFEVVSDPTKPFITPKPKEPVPYLNFAPLQNALAKLQQSAQEYDKAMGKATSSGKSIPAKARQSLNEILMKAERALTRPEGLPRRPWYVHQIYAPGAYTGYGVKTLPSVREAIELQNWKEAEDQIPVVAQVLEKFAEDIDRATTILSDAMTK